MGNQMEKALKEVEAAIDPTPLDKLEAQLDAPAETDKMLDAGNNIAERVAAEEPNDIAEMRSIIAEQNKTIEAQEEKLERVINVMGKMVTRYGAEVSDSTMSSNTDAFPSEEAEENTIPLLKDIKLG